MYKINVKVESNKVDIISQTVPITTKSLNVFKCVFDLPHEYEGLSCVAVFTYVDKIYKEMIVDNECVIPHDILYYNDRIKLGVYAFKGEEIVYSPVATSFKIEVGSYTEETSEETEVNQSAFDKLVEKANNLYLKIEKADTDLDTKVAEINQKLENGDFNGKNGKDGVNGQDGKDGINGQDGADGRDGVDGQDGFSPSISVKPDTDDKYILEITNKDGKIETPNLKGRDGTNGKDGVQGIQGEKGEKGDTGQDGKSAYEIAVDLGFEGTEQEWLDSLKSEETDIDLSQYAKKEEVPLVYFWDGKDSTTNPDNIQFFQEILDKYLEGKNVLVVNNSIQSGMRTTLSYTFDKTKEYELTSNTLVSFATSNQYSIIGYNVLKIKLSVIDNIVNEVIKSSTSFDVEQFLSIKNANNTYYFIPTKKSQPISKGFLDEVVGDINSILDAINGEVVGDEPTTLKLEDDIEYINNDSEEVIEDGNE